ncbi:hypothetical protein LTR94_026741, partial [Friedmanniomyces endolithicus]
MPASRKSDTAKSLGVAIIGCGYVADFYMSTLVNHSNLRLIGAFDKDAVRLAAFCKHHRIAPYGSQEELLASDDVDLVLNLTNPSSHFSVSLSCLEAGKHVYSEKPLALNLEDGERLVAVARSRRLSLVAAPATVLGEAAAAVRSVLDSGRLGKVRVVYAELEDGMVFNDGCDGWRSQSGAPWPWRDEFEVG